MKKLFYKSKKISDMLFEQEEEDLFATDEGGDEAADEGTDDTDAADDAGETAEPGEEGEGEEAEEAEEAEVPPEAEQKLGKVIDDDLEALMVDFETQARQSKKIEKDRETIEPVAESYGLKFLLESEYAQDIDLERFTSEIARLIKNYDTLLDMEDLILSKAKSFIIGRYGEEAAKDMEESLADNHSIEIEDTSGIDSDAAQVPVAVGAGTPVGGA